MKKAGYATNPKYADILIKLINDYQLYDYDQSYVIAENRSNKSNNNQYIVAGF